MSSYLEKTTKKLTRKAVRALLKQHVPKQLYPWVVALIP